LKEEYRLQVSENKVLWNRGHLVLSSVKIVKSGRPMDWVCMGDKEWENLFKMSMCKTKDNIKMDLKKIRMMCSCEF
jgi:hypothetical protein